MCFNVVSCNFLIFLLTEHFNILISLKVLYSLLQSIKHSCPMSWELWLLKK